MVINNKNFATISAQSLDIRCKTMRLARILRGLVIYYHYFITATRKFAPSRLDNSACALLVCGVSQTVARTNKAVLTTSLAHICVDMEGQTFLKISLTKYGTGRLLRSQQKSAKLSEKHPQFI